MSQTITSTLKSHCIAEFLGTGMIVLLGSGCIAAMKLTDATFSQWEISMIWGLAVSMAVYMTAGVSGAHLNPAVTVALCFFANFDKHKVIPYIISQVTGAFSAAALVYVLYYDLFINYEISHHLVRNSMESLSLAGIFSTYPNTYISVGHAFLVEIVITAVLVLVIMALTDDSNGVPRGPLVPLLIGLLIAIIGSAMGPLTGFALNPARDFGPKIFTYLIGWGKVVLTGGRDIPYLFVPIFGPLIGGCLGALGYRSIIACHLQRNINLIHKNKVNESITTQDAQNKS